MRALYAAAVVGSIFAPACAGLFAVEDLPEETAGGGAGAGGAVGGSGGGSGQCHDPLPACLTNASAACLSYVDCEGSCHCDTRLGTIDCDDLRQGQAAECQMAEALAQASDGVSLVPLMLFDACWGCCPESEFPAVGVPLAAQSFDGTLAQLGLGVPNGFRAVGLDLDVRFSSQLGRDALKVVVRTQNDAWTCTATVPLAAQQCNQDVHIRFASEGSDSVIACDPEPEEPLTANAYVEFSADAPSSEIAALLLKPYVILAPLQ